MGSLNGEVLNFTSDNPQKFTELKVTFSPKQEGTGDSSPTNVYPITGYSSIDVFLNDKQSETGATKYTIEFPEEAGTVYGGYVDFVNSELVVEWAEWIEDGSRNIPYWPWSKSTDGNSVFALFNGLPSDVQRIVTVTDKQKINLCENRSYYDINAIRNQTNPYVFGVYSVSALSYAVGYPTGLIGETKAELQAYLAEHPEKFIYKLAEPKHYPLNIYKTYRTLLGTNVVWTNGDTIEAEVKDYPQGTTAKTETGSVLNFNTYQPKQLTETKISFTPSQEGQGTPSPENIREIAGKSSITLYQQGDDGVTHETSVSFPSVGKNLFDGEWRKGRYVDGVWTNTNTWRTSELIPVESNTAYCVSVDEPRTIGKIYCNLFDRNGNWIGSDYGTSITTTADTALMTICNTNNVVSAWTDIQLEKGSTATAYEPFDNTVYGGYVDLVNGEVVEEKDGLVFDGSEAWYLYSSNKYACVFALKPGRKPLDQNEVCSHFKINGQAFSPSANHVNSAIWGSNSGTVFMQVSPSFASDITAFKQFLADEAQKGTPVTIMANALNPIHYSLTPQSIATLKGQNVMWSDGDSLTISYTDDVVNTYDFRRHISLDTPHKASASGAVASFGTDMVGKMKCKIHFSPQQEGSGTPSPDNVRNISGRSSVKLWQSGKNMLNPNDADWGQYTINSTGGHTEETDRICSGYIPCNEGDTYTFSGSVMGSLIYVMSFVGIAGFDKDKVYVSRSMANHVSAMSYTVPNGVKYIRVFEEAPKYPNITMAIWCNTLKRQLEIGSTATEYEPYTGNEITFTFPSTVGDNGVVYGGYLDAENGEVVQEYYTFTLDGTNNKLGSGGTILNGNECEAYAYFGQGTLSGIPRGRGTSYTQLYSNLLPTVRQTSGRGEIVQADDVVNYIRVQLYAETIGVASGATSTEVIDAINTWLTAHPMQVCYPLRDPVHYSLTPQSIATLRGSNRLWSDGDSVEVEYYKHTDEPQEYIPAEVLGTGNIAIVTSDGYLIGEEQDYIKY